MDRDTAIKIVNAVDKALTDNPFLQQLDGYYIDYENTNRVCYLGAAALGMGYRVIGDGHPEAFIAKNLIDVKSYDYERITDWNNGYEEDGTECEKLNFRQISARILTELVDNE